MVSPTSNGACWVGSAGTGYAAVDAWPRAGMTNWVQYPPAGVALSSPLAGGTTPAMLKLRHCVTAGTSTPPTRVLLRAGRLRCGHSGSSVTAGSVRGTHIGYPVPAWMVGLAWST